MCNANGLFVSHLPSKAAVSETSLKRVTSPAWKLGWAEKGPAFAVQFDWYFQHRKVLRCAIEFTLAWQELMPEPEPDTVFHAWPLNACHEIADALEPVYRPGLAVTDVGCFPDSIKLPCRDCGGLFDSRFRGRRFARKCGLCRPNRPREPANPRGGRVMYFRGFYPATRPGTKLAGEQYGQSVPCDYPGCEERFLTNRSDAKYCEQHREVHPQARARAQRRRTERPKQ